MTNCLLARAFIEISGLDCKKFLQGLITNDINKLQSDNLLYSAMLSPQGRFLYDFFIFEIKANDSLSEQKLLLDCHKSVVDELIKKLNFYKLRSQVVIKKNEEFTVFVSKEDLSLNSDSEGFKEVNSEEKSQISNLNQEIKIFCFADPRNSKMGYRIYVQNFLQNSDKFSDKFASDLIIDELSYHGLRIGNKIAEGVYDLTVGEDFILHFGFDDLGAVDYQKGCYVGQETTARMHYRGEIHKKIYHFCIEEFSDELIEHLQEYRHNQCFESVDEGQDFLQKSLDYVKNCEIFWGTKSCGIALSAVLNNKKIDGLAIIKAQDQKDLQEIFSNLTLLSSKIKIIG